MNKKAKEDTPVGEISGKVVFEESKRSAMVTLTIISKETGR